MSAPSTTAVTPSAAAQSNTLDSMTLRNRHTDKTLSNYQALLAFVGKDPLAEAFLSWLENNGCSTKEEGERMAAAVQRIQEAAGLARSLWLELEQGTKTHEQVLEEARSLYKELLPLKKYTKRFDTFKDQVRQLDALIPKTTNKPPTDSTVVDGISSLWSSFMDTASSYLSGLLPAANNSTEPPFTGGCDDTYMY